MKLISTIFAIGMAVIFLRPSQAVGQTPEEAPVGEFGASLGGVYPQGDFVTFSDPGPGFDLRLNIRPESFRSLSLKISFGGSFFKSENEEIFVDVPSGPLLLAEKTVSQTAWTLHAGLQLGNGSRRGFFRPRVSLSPGLYIFNIKTGYKWDGADEDFYDENETQAKFGWRGTIGASLFFTTGWGLSFDFVNDRVYSLHQTTVVDDLGRIISRSVSAEFHSYMVGIVVPLDKL